MPKVRWLRWTAWSTLVGVLVALGVGIYQSHQHEPRWQTGQNTLPPNDDFVDSVHFSSDGARVITYTRRAQSAGPVAVWDRDTGKMLAQYPKVGEFLSTPAFSENARYCVGHTQAQKEAGEEKGRHSIVVIDFDEGRELHIPSSEDPGEDNLVFSPSADIFAHAEQGRLGPLSIYDRATGKLLDRRPHRELFGPITDDFVVYSLPGKDKQRTVELWSVATRKPVATLREPGWNPRYLSLDRRALIFSKPAADEAPDETARCDDETARWDLASRQFKLVPGAALGVLSPDGKWGFEWSYQQYHLREVGTGKLLGAATSPEGMEKPVFSPDSGLLIVPRNMAVTAFMPAPPTPRPEAPRQALQAFAIPSMDLRWKRGRDASCIALAFSRDGKTIYAAFLNEKAMDLLDAETGELRGAIDMPCAGTTRIDPTPDGRYLLIRRYDDGPMRPAQTLPEVVLDWLKSFFSEPGRSRETIVVFDTVSNRERFRLTGLECSGAYLSDDGATLITTHDKGGSTVMRCWDVAPKPLHWAVGIPAAFGVVLIALVLGYGRWRRKKA